MTNNKYTAHSMFELLESCPINQTICDNLIKAWARINNRYEKIVCSISGGVIQT